MNGLRKQVEGNINLCGKLRTRHEIRLNPIDKTENIQHLCTMFSTLPQTELYPESKLYKKLE